jgi:phosphatidylglycerophosphatase A
MKDRLIYLLGTGFGCGYSPIAPGTIGSLVAILLFVLIPLSHIYWLIIALLTFLVGIRISGYIEVNTEKDPGIIVIDEYVGQWISLLFLPRSISVFLAGFFLFRFFDIVKPFPANISQRIEGGLGVMLDDVWAGIYTNLVLQILTRFIF